MLKEGDRIPAFELEDQEGKKRSSADFAGKPLVVYFYPKDDTPGCTKEACGIRDSWAEFRARGVSVVGISADSSVSHAKFVKKFDLPFILLADPDKEAIRAFGAWGEKTMYGKSYEGILRSTFVVGADGIIMKTFPKVSPEGHAAEILGCLS
ncbi:MAG: peroxiredoxin [Treponema sp. GWB1_62_6]|nr:MAG: peroxiredoxin [Treponema sp. GWB1_62_6]OHE63517.1 MAG: peroxiredoxin [Treponema sp. GWA1_62_8]OHE66153.1 MAG: peroxiredoxin [Treponema sp. GWC1_61_84]OHE71749.1 MAG: peroxiredoxin [Treponema sp. RIFOXYC1_FULL_61_9]HCM25759.1 thioredoxin-dependent thiol peroxidase [Treponema sp.]